MPRLKILIIYLLAISFTGFILMAVDKRKAIKHKWRISEFALFVPAFLGGTLGCIAGMTVFRHKTKHIKFTLGMPAILILQIALAVFLIYKF